MNLSHHFQIRIVLSVLKIRIPLIVFVTVSPAPNFQFIGTHLIAAFVLLPQFPPQDLDFGRREGLDLFGAFGGRRENDAEAGIAGNDVADQGVAIAGIECVIDLLDTGIGQMLLVIQIVDELLNIIS